MKKYDELAVLFCLKNNLPELFKGDNVLILDMEYLMYLKDMVNNPDQEIEIKNKK